MNQYALRFSVVFNTTDSAQGPAAYLPEDHSLVKVWRLSAQLNAQTPEWPSSGRRNYEHSSEILLNGPTNRAVCLSPGDNGFQVVKQAYTRHLRSRTRRATPEVLSRRFAPRCDIRHNLNKLECERLGSHMRDFKRLEASKDWRGTREAVREVADLLNDASAGSTILRNLGCEPLEYGECGHFHHASDGSCTHNSTICEECAAGGDWITPEDTDYYCWREELYLHDCGDWYSYAEEVEDEDGDNHVLGRWGYNTNVLDHVSRDDSFTTTSGGKFHIGVEFECVPQDPEDFCREVYDHFGREKALCKEDGSLPDRGVEVVTAPLEYTEQVQLFKGMDFTGVSAWDSGDCGLHVHIDSFAFTKLTLAKFLMFWNAPDNEALIRKVAGRHPNRDSQAQSYAALSESAGTTLPTNALKGHQPHRYRLVNLMNLTAGRAEELGLELETGSFFGRYNTVELRIFRASCRTARLTAQIEMAAASVYFSRLASWSALTESDFRKFVTSNVGMFPNLARFLNISKQASRAPSALEA